MTERVETSPNLIWPFEEKAKLPNLLDKKEFNDRAFYPIRPKLDHNVNNKGTKVCSRFRFSVLFFNLKASLQPLIPAQDKSSCLLYIKANTIAVKKCEHTFLLWTFETLYVSQLLANPNMNEYSHSRINRRSTSTKPLSSDMMRPN
jgi:hypothetical protein